MVDNGLFRSLTAEQGRPFAPQNVSPSPPVFIGPEDTLWASTFNALAGITVQLRGRILRPSGELGIFRFSFSPAATMIEDIRTFPIGEGFLINLIAEVPISGGRRGRTFIIVGVARGSGTSTSDIQETRFEHTVVIQSYIGKRLHAAWPEGRIEWSTDGAGLVNSVTGTDPAAGVEILETVPTGRRWRLMGVTATLVTAVAVATRIARLEIVDSGGVRLSAHVSSTSQAASLTKTYYWTPGNWPDSQGSSVHIMIGLPIKALLGQSFIIRTATENLQAADNWGAPQIWVEEWIEP